MLTPRFRPRRYRSGSVPHRCATGSGCHPSIPLPGAVDIQLHPAGKRELDQRCADPNRSACMARCTYISACIHTYLHGHVGTLFQYSRIVIYLLYNSSQDTHLSTAQLPKGEYGPLSELL